jgi:Ala-tRNA(Pro) deacylase
MLMTDFYVSEPMATVTENYKSPAQQSIFETLTRLDIPFLRVDTGDGTTMEACIPIGAKLENPVIKTVFVTNRQQTLFWLYIMAPDKPFVTKEFCGALGIPRVSFASEEHLVSMMGTPHGATTVLALINDKQHRIQLVIDKSIAQSQYISCTDGTNTGFVRLSMADLLDKYLHHTGHNPVLI